MVFKALRSGGSNRDDVSSRGSVRRKSSAAGGDDSSRTSSSRRPSKTTSASSVSSSRRPIRGDDRDRGLEDISASRSVTGDSTTTYVTAEPASYVNDDDEPLIIERTPRSDRDNRQRSSRDTGDRDSRRKSEKRYSEDRPSRDDTNGRERTRPRAQSGGDTTAHFAAEIANPGFNQFPMQYDSSNIPGTASPYHPPLDSHISQQFPGQLPNTTAQPYFPPNPAGHAADYYNDQGQSVAHQPGVRPQAPDVIIGAEPHLQAASPIANPPPEPSSLGQVGAAAEYYAAGDSLGATSTPASTRPPKPSKPSKPSSSRPSKPASQYATAGEAATFGIGSELMNQASANYTTTSGTQSRPPMQTTGGSSSSHNGVGLALGGAAAGAAAAYMINHHNDQSHPNAHHSSTHYESYGVGIPTNGTHQQSTFQGNTNSYTTPGYANRPPSGPFYPTGGVQPGSLAYHQKHHGPLAAFVDFWRDPEGVGKFEDYTEAIGVCKYCFEPGTSSLNAPRKHHYNRRRRSPVVDRYGSSSRVEKLTRYNSSEDESRRKKSKGTSWLAGGLAGGLAGYVAKSLFSSKDFEDTYSVRSGTRVESSRRHEYDEESLVSSAKASSTSRGVISRKRSSDDKFSASKDSRSSHYLRRSSRSRSRSRSRDRRTSSGLKEAAIGAAVGTALTAAATRSSERNRSRDRSTRNRRRHSDSSDSVDIERSRRRGRSSPRSFKSFFTAPSANRRKKSSRKERGFFSFGNSSSSSGDFDLAFGGSELFGSSVSGRSSKSSKSSRKQNVDAEILGLGLAARKLASSSSRKELRPRDLARPPNHGRSSGFEDEEWEDAESSDSAISTNLAYGGSAIFGSSESVTSGSSFWPWSSSSRKQKKAQRQNTQPPPSNQYPYYSNDYASQDGSSGRGSLQQVVPVPTSDPTRFDVVRMSTSSSPNAQPPLVRPGPIPLQQPQPFTPVSQSVYYPTVTAPSDPIVPRIGLEDNSSRDIQRPRRRNSSPPLPVAPLDGSSQGILKWGSTTKDTGTVSFNLTEEQRKKEVDRHDKERQERRRKEDLAALREEADEIARRERRRLEKEKKKEERRLREEAEAEEAARNARRDRIRKENQVDDRSTATLNGDRRDFMEDAERKTDQRKEPSSSSWVTPAIVAGATVAAGALAEKAFEDDWSSAPSSHKERRAKREAERRSTSESQSVMTEVPRQVSRQSDIDVDDVPKEQRTAKIHIKQTQSPTAHESYEDFFTPEEIRHHDDRGDSSPNIVDIVPKSERRVEPYLGSDLDKPDPSWPPLVINIIKPTPPGSYDGSVRDAHSPVPTTPEPTEKEQPKEEEVEPTPVRPTTGSRISWGQDQFIEYEAPTPLSDPLSDREEHFEEFDHHENAVLPEIRGVEQSYEPVVEEESSVREVKESESDSKHSMPGSFDDDVEFAATLAAGAEIAGFDPTVVTHDASYFGKDHLSKFQDAYRPPAVESVTDLGETVPIQSGSEQKESRAPNPFDYQEALADERELSASPPKSSGSGRTGTRSVAVTESEDLTSSEILDRKSMKELRDDTVDSIPDSSVSDESKKSKKKKRRSKTLDEFDIESQEQPSRQTASNDYSESKRSVKSDQEDFEPMLKRVESAPVTDDWIEENMERSHRKSKQSSSDRTESPGYARSVAASAPGADELEEYRSRRSSRRSKDEDGDLEDDSRSLPDTEDNGEKRRRRKHKRHSGNFDDAASVVSSPAKIDETREKRRSRESSTASTQRSREPEKKSGGFFGLFGSRSTPERSSSTSGKRETQSEVGVDDNTSERRRKKKSSSSGLRRSLSGEGLDGWDAASEAAQSTMDLSQLDKAMDGEDGDNDSHSSHRKRKERRRREKYEDIVDSARDASEKDRLPSAGDNDDDKKSFLGIRPEMPPVKSHEEDSTRDLIGGGASGLAITAGALGLGSLAMVDQLHDTTQRLRSRSVSPSMAERTFDLAPRSQSRPSSPGGGSQEDKELRARRLSLLRTSDSPTAVPLHFRKPPTSPNGSRRVSMTSPAQSPSSPRNRRPNSMEFKNVREIRPLWLVERHSTSKLDVEPEGPLPSLPSSKTSSRSPSVENLREGYDDGEDAVTGFFMGSGGGVDSPYSWGRKPVDLRISTEKMPAEEEDFLNSQQATPTAETYNIENKEFGPPPIKKEKPKYEFHSPSELLQDPTTFQSMVPELPESLDRLPSVAGSDLGGKEVEANTEDSAKELQESVPLHEDRPNEQKSGISSFLAGAGFASIVDAAVSAAVKDTEPSTKVENPETVSRDISEDAGHHEQAIDSSKPQSLGGFGNVVDSAVAAAVSQHASHDVIDAEDATVETAQAEFAKDISPPEPSVEEEPKAVTDTEASSGSSKKQKRKDKKKKKKSKDLDAPAEDNEEGDAAGASVPVVELDSSMQPEVVPDVEAERAAAPTDQTSTDTLEQQQSVSHEVEPKNDFLNLITDQPLSGEAQEVAEHDTRELGAPTEIVETEPVTASAEDEQTTAGTNDQPTHVAAEPEDEGSSSLAATSSKSSKKKKKNKKKSQSLSESVSGEMPETVVTDKAQIDSSMTVTDEPKSIDDAVEEKPVLEEIPANMPSESFKTTTEQAQDDKIEPKVLDSVERSASDEGDFVMVEQAGHEAPELEQNRSLDSPVDEWFDSAETAEAPPAESVTVSQDVAKEEIQPSEISQDLANPEPVETKPMEDEPATTSSSKKKDKKKKKKKGQSSSVDETAPQEMIQESSETAPPPLVGATAQSLEGEVAQAGDIESQSRDIEGALPEISASLPVESEPSSSKFDSALTSSPTEIAQSAGVPASLAEQAVENETTPKQPEEIVQPQTSDDPAKPDSFEALPSETIPISAEQSTKDIEATEATPTQAAFEEVPSTPTKSKKKKGKKGKRVSWAEGAELAVESEPATPADESATPMLEDVPSAVASEDSLPAAEEGVVPSNAELESLTVPEIETSHELESDVPTPAETFDSAALSSAETDQLESSSELQPVQQIEAVEKLDDQLPSLPSESSKSEDANILPEEETEQSEGASSKGKKKKDKKKDKKKKKAAEASALVDQETLQQPDQPAEDIVKDVVEDNAPETSEPVDATPIEQPVAEEMALDKVSTQASEFLAPEASEPTAIAEVPASEEHSVEPRELHTSEALESPESTPADQVSVEEQAESFLPNDILESSAPLVTADEPKSTEIAQEEEETQGSSKSKKKKDKKKKKAAAAAMTSEQDLPDTPVTEEAKDIAEAVVSDNAENVIVEESKTNDEKEVDVVESITVPPVSMDTIDNPVNDSHQESAQLPASEPIQETVQEPMAEPVQELISEPIPEAVEETKAVDLADEEPIQTTSKSKKKDKKKKKATENLMLKEQDLASKEVIEDSTPATPAETLEQTESKLEDAQMPDEQVEETLTTAETDKPQPVDSLVEAETPAEVAADDEWAPTTSKSKKKKDKKKKQAEAAFSFDEKPASSEPVVEEITANAAEPEVVETQEQSILEDTKKEMAEQQTTELSTNEVKTGDKTEDDGWAQETSSKKKKKDKKKKAVAAFSIDDEPQTPVEEQAAELSENALSEAQDLSAVKDEKLDDISIDQDVRREITHAPAEIVPAPTQELQAIEELNLDDKAKDQDVPPEIVETLASDANAAPVAAEDEWAETPSKSKKKDKKKKKAAEVLPWDEVPSTSDKPLDGQGPAEIEASSSQAQEDATLDDRLPNDSTEDQVTETPIFAEEKKEDETPEDDTWSQKTSKSKKKDKKKRKSLQLEAAQDVSTADAAAEETIKVPEDTLASESIPAMKDVSMAVDESKDVEAPDTQSREVLQEASAPVQDDNIEDEGTGTKSIKSKKKKDKKKKSKDEPFPLDEEPPIKTSDVEPEDVTDQPTATMDMIDEESARELEGPLLADSAAHEDQGSVKLTEVISAGEDLPHSADQLPADSSGTVQPEESAPHQLLADATENHATAEQSLDDVPASTAPEETVTNDDAFLQTKSGKRSKKKKKRGSLLLDEEPLDKNEPLTAPSFKDGDEAAANDTQEKQSEPTSTGEPWSQQESNIAEPTDLASADADVVEEKEDDEAADAEPTKQLSAKEKRKEKKKQKRRTLDLTDDPNSAVADDTTEATAPVEPPVLDEQQKDDIEASDDFAPAGKKKKGKKNKRQSVSWEEEVIQAEPNSDETVQALADSESNIPPPKSKDLDSVPGQVVDELQETPVEVEGKETFQSSEETSTDQKEKDFDWTDNVVSPQVQSQTEESHFPVRSPISDERDDPDQSRPTTAVAAVDDSQSHEAVIPEAVADQDSPAGIQQEEPTDLATADTKPIDQEEAEDIDWTASKNSKKNKKKKKQKSIATVAEESPVNENITSENAVEQNDKTDKESEVVNTEQEREIQEEQGAAEDLSLLPDVEPLRIVETEQSREVQEEPAPTEEAPLVTELAPAVTVNAEEEFKPAGSSKKKGKKNKKNQSTKETFVQSSDGAVKEEADAVDQEIIEMQEQHPLAPETMQEMLAEDMAAKDILEEKPEENLFVQENLPESEIAPTSDLPTRKLSKKEKRKMKKGKLDFEEDEPVAKSVEEKMDIVNSEQFAEAAEEKVNSGPITDDIPNVHEKPVEPEPAFDEAPVSVDEQQIAVVKPVDIETVSGERPVSAKEKHDVDEQLTTIVPVSEKTPLATKEEQVVDVVPIKPVFEEASILHEVLQAADMKPAEEIPDAAPIAFEKQFTDMKPAEPVLEEAPIYTEKQVADEEVQVAPVQEVPVTRKLSKKEKRKNKKRMTEDWPEEEPSEASRDIAPESDVVEPVAAEEPKNKSTSDVAVETSTGVEPERAHVSLDPFDMPDAEDGDADEPPADWLVNTDIAERHAEPKLDANAALHARQLEQEADLAVAASLFGESVEPEQVVSRKSSKKQKGKKSKKDKENTQFEKAIANDTVIAPQPDTAPKEEEIMQKERHDTKPFASSEEVSRSLPSIDFDNGLHQAYLADRNVPKERESEHLVQHKELPAQDLASVNDDFRAEESRKQTPRSISDEKIGDTEESSHLGHRSHSPSQKEDVDMILSATMAAAGFFPSIVTAPAESNTFTDMQSTSGTSRGFSEVYEHRDVFSDTPSKSSITTFDATNEESKSNNIAGLFPGLERVKYRKPSPKSHEKQTTNTITAEEPNLPVVTPVKTLKKTESTHRLSSRELPGTIESTSKDRSSSLLFDPSPSTRLEPTPETTRRAASSPIRLQHQISTGSLHRAQSIHGHHSDHPSGSLHRTKSIIHGHHADTARSWQLEEEKTPTKKASSHSPQLPLRAENLDGISPPRTPLDPIKEHDGARLPSPSPRLVMGEGAYKLERPDSRNSVRSSRSLRKANRSISGDLRAMAAQEPQPNPDGTSGSGLKKGKAGRPAAPDSVGYPQPLDPHSDSDFFDNNLNHHHDDDDRRHLENIPSSSSYDPVTDKGKRPVRGMSDVYEGWGETPNSPRSPTRPPSVRRRQSMQHLQELETRLDQLISENRLLAAAKDEAEQKLSRVGIARRKSDQALNTSNADLRDKEAEIARLTKSLEWMQTEVQRLTSENEAVIAKHAELTASHAREVDSLRTRQLELASGMEGIVREQISAALAEKDAELRRLRDELAAARQAVQELQQQIVAATADDVLSIHDEDYFDNSCQRLCQHVQQWVLRFSKHSDLRRCRPLSEVRNNNVADRFDNAILDGTDIDTILADRVRRRDVFVAVVMAMIWEYVFTRYLFGMDREQRQKLKALEKQLSEIGPRRAVAHWRALTLTLLSKRPSFADQRVRDTEAVALEIMETLSQLLPPPQSAQSQLLESLRGVLRRAANLSIEMRTQRAEYVMLPPLQPEYDAQGDLARQVSFNASLMNERSGLYNSNELLESQGTPVRLVLFPLVVKKGNDLGDGDEEIVVCPAQVLVAWPENEKPRDRMSALGNRSVSSVVPSVDMGNVI